MSESIYGALNKKAEIKHSGDGRAMCGSGLAESVVLVFDTQGLRIGRFSKEEVMDQHVNLTARVERNGDYLTWDDLLDLRLELIAEKKAIARSFGGNCG